MLKPLAGAFKNPLTGVLATVGVIGGAVLLKFTLELMLGVTDAGVYMCAVCFVCEVLLKFTLELMRVI